MTRLAPKNWARFQHYRDRSPPWIKLHRDLLNDREFMSLPLASKALAPLLWLLACESADGSFDGSFEELSWRLRMSPKDVKSGLDGLLRSGLFVEVVEDASDVLADASSTLASATSEREGEREGETETEGEARVRARTLDHSDADGGATDPDPTPKQVKPKLVTRPTDVPEQVWSDWIAHRRGKRATVTETAMDGIRREAKAAGMSLADALAHAVAQGWQGFRAEWVVQHHRALSRNGVIPKTIPKDYYSGDAVQDL